MSSNRNATVIGAGVSGLTTAILLKQQNYNVTIVAKHLPGDLSIEYTSPWAGAHWRSMAGANAKLIQYDKITFEKLSELARTTPDTGIMFVESKDYFEEDTSIWYEKFSPNFKWIPKEKLPDRVKIGCEYTTVTINTSKYLHWLQSQLEDQGCKFIRRNLGSIYDVADDSTDVIVNCSGLAARSLGGVNDSNVFPTRGQTVLVRAPNIKTTLSRIWQGGLTYIIPRDNGEVILGGTYQPHDDTPLPDETTGRTILQNCYELFPDLSQGKGWEAIEVIRHNVGLRPTRTGDVRVEVETWVSSKGKRVIICHNYGHGGYGYQSSWGTSTDALEKIQKKLEELD